jgi:hypothetical protein
MKSVFGLFEARPFWKLRADQSLVLGDNPRGAGHVRAALATEGEFAVLYLPTGQLATVATGSLSGDKLTAWWFNPRQNSSQLIGTFPKQAHQEFTPPTAGRNNDWVLVLDSTTQDPPPLGFSSQQLIPAIKELKSRSPGP